ncbi:MULTISPECIES: SDR family oxidoreductase [Kribbella]|uniref:3-oxoacyl-[acyl-carrier protein] reductase n=1 Tax=Kribbella pratensis TaxID=2512112 RepID=A0ABY2FL71_9ACTN|nr:MULTISPECIES: SDR family oxidoreductase [Kribbella]TDW86268.1 3-oxoacyl-[acyl-carrier protein] reductase [Kribbella sp. VKM Ac-2566]TDW93672.1 3-oxoacyl-[acyl-carrier protein] reductase [Kribbella pratensis]
MDLGLRDRTYIVTGASAGLGFATAKALAAEGARLVISSRNEESIARAAAELNALPGPGGNVVGISVDNADPDSAERLAATAIAKWGELHGALISVGGPRAGTALDTDEEDWRSAFDSVFLGGLRIARAVARAGAEDTSIAFVLSSSVKSPIAGLAISNGLRPGLAMVAKTLADELGPNGMRVNGLMPGRIATDRLKELDGKSGDPEAARRASEKTIPLRRYGSPDEFGRVAAFVLSPAASYVTGAIIPIDGGALRTF